MEEMLLKPSSQSRAEALSHLDDAKLGWFHLRAVLVSGAGFFTDAYDIFVISQALPMIYQLYFSSLIPVLIINGTNTSAQNTRVDFAGVYPHVDSWLKASTNWGNLVGQVTFGYLGDVLGRKKMYGVELIIMIICTVGSALVYSSSGLNSGDINSAFWLVGALSCWRFLLGIGIGGDYPMSAVITSEFANVRYRGMMLAAVFAMQGIGILIGGLVYVITLASFRNTIQRDYKQLDWVWRFAIGFGIVPALGAVYFRLTIPETPRFTVDVMGDHEQASRDVQTVIELNTIANVTSTWSPPTDDKTRASGEEVKPYTDNSAGENNMDLSGDLNNTILDFQSEHDSGKGVEKVNNSYANFKAYFGQWKNFKVLFATAYCWFALDVAWYGLALNQSVVLSLINFNGPSKQNLNVTRILSNGSRQTSMIYMTPPHDIWDTFYQTAVGNIIIACAGTVPGYWVTVALIEKLGRKPIQYTGFAVITVILFILAAGWESLSKNQFWFVLLFTIAQFGPNTTTFVIPGEVFPTRWRSTCHGLASASGKLGAIIGIEIVGPFFNRNASAVLFVFGIIMATGGICTIFLPETAGKRLEEICDE